METAVLEKKKSWMERVRGILPQLQHELESQVLCQRNRTVLVSLVFFLSLGSGFVVGTLLLHVRGVLRRGGGLHVARKRR
jgi:hypothetical protein